MSKEYPCNCPCMDCIVGDHCGGNRDASEFGQPEVKFSCGYWWISEQEEERQRDEYDRLVRFFSEAQL